LATEKSLHAKKLIGKKILKALNVNSILLTRLSCVRKLHPKRIHQIDPGLKICELPLVVKKVDDVLRIGESSAPDGKSSASVPGIVTLTYPQDMDPETSEILSGFNRCFTASGIFRLLVSIL
jgi:hypothetical protein